MCTLHPTFRKDHIDGALSPMYCAGTLYQLDLNTVRLDPEQPRKYLDRSGKSIYMCRKNTGGYLVGCPAASVYLVARG